MCHINEFLRKLTISQSINPGSGHANHRNREAVTLALRGRYCSALRRRLQAGLNKGGARNALARAVFMHRLGEIRDRKPENQSYRASGLTLLTAAISLWNTVYMERAIDALKRKGLKINEQLLSHLSPLGSEHINLTGDYIWKSNRIPASGKFRRVRSAKV